MSPTLSVFATFEHFFCYAVSGEVSGEVLLFHERTVFCYNVAKAGLFLLEEGVFLLHSVNADLTVQDN